MPAKLYLFPLVMIGVCIYLIYRCFLPYFWGIPDYLYNRRFYTEEQMHEKARAENPRGYVLTVLVIALSVYFGFPFVKDWVHIAKGEYLYSVVQVYDEYSVSFYPEYVYDPETNALTYDADAVPRDRKHDSLDVHLSEENVYYLVRYVPETRSGEVLSRLDETKLEKMKTGE